MEKRYYELLYVVIPTLSEDELKGVMEDVAGIITREDGEILKNELWQKRNLAYPIKKFKQGYYILVHFKAPPGVPRIVEEKLRIRENVLRYMVTNMLKKDMAKYQKQDAQKENQPETGVTQKEEDNGKSE